MDKFKVGQKVRVLDLHSDRTEIKAGMTGTVASKRKYERLNDGNTYFAYRVDLDATGLSCPEYYFEEHCLEPVDEKGAFERFLDRVLLPVEVA